MKAKLGHVVTLPEKFVAQRAAALAGSNRDSDCING